MGTFGTYGGNMNIKEECKEKFNHQMSRILNLGGMMEVEDVKMFGIKLPLLRPVEVCAGEKVYFHYNYFEDRGWETAVYNATEAYLGSEKIGSFEFNEVMMAAYTLYEAYDDDIGYALENGDIISSSMPTGWLNQILGTEFSMKKRFRLWEFAEKYALSRMEEGYSDYFSDKHLMEYIPSELRYLAGGTEFADLMYIIHGTKTLEGEELTAGSYPEDVLRCKRSLEDFLSRDGNNEILGVELLKQFMIKDKTERKTSSLVSEDIVKMSLIIPARVLLYLTAEITNQNFWKLWMEMKGNVYHDEEMKKYASDDLETLRKETRESPIEKVSTSEYLRQDGYFAFYHTPDELKGKPNYYLSDDDRLYWWDGTDEVIISQETDKWLKELADEYKKFKKITVEDFKHENFIENFMKLFDSMNERYVRIYPFQNMFYDFIMNAQNKDYLAAVELIRFVADNPENIKDGKVIEHANGRDWDLVSKNVTHNAGRMKVKRILSVMANKKLREKYFGF